MPEANSTEVFSTLLARYELWRGLGAPPWLFFASLLFVTWAAGLGVTLAYHRVLTHRAAKLTRPLAYFFVTFGSPAGTPVQWVGNHRHHHAVTDTPKDEHSPRHYGFWVAQAGWYLHTQSTALSVLYTFAGPLRMLFDAFWRPRTNQQYAHLARDIAKDPYYRFLSTPFGYALVQLTYLFGTYGLTLLLFGLRYTLGLAALHVVFYAIGDLVNSAGHLWGTRPFATRDNARDSWWLGLLAFGDGYHNGHHAFPSSIRSGFQPGQLDSTWLWCRLFEQLGLARDLRVPSERDLTQKRALATMPPAREAE